MSEPTHSTTPLTSSRATNPRKYKWSLSDLTPKNIRQWKRVRWPHGIKKDLAALVKTPSTPPKHHLIFQSPLCEKSLSYTAIYCHSVDMKLGELVVHRYSFLHPKFLDERDVIAWKLDWKIVGSIIIPGRAAHAWRCGIRRMLAVPRERIPEVTGKYVYQIQFGRRCEPGERLKAVRFAVREDSKGAIEYDARVWVWVKDRGRMPTRAGIRATSLDVGVLDALDLGLEWAQMHGVDLLPADDAEEFEYD